jgi:hypothetical protein
VSKIDLNADIDEQGVFTLNNRQRFVQWCNENIGKNIRVRFTRAYGRRSTPQNSYYWGVVIKEISIRLRDLGHQWLEDEDVHLMMKLKFNHEDVVSEEGEVLELPKSTTSLTTVEFMEYIDRVRQWAAGFLNIHIPEPNENLNLKL